MTNKHQLENINQGQIIFSEKNFGLNLPKSAQSGPVSSFASSASALPDAMAQQRERGKESGISLHGTWFPSLFFCQQ
jgi:hypothetical protein